MDINDRLQFVVDELFDGKKASFAKSIGLAPTSISNYLSKSRSSKPSSDILESIARNIPSLNIEWLITGEGDMLKNNSKTNSIHNIGDGNQSSIGGQIQNKSYKVEKNQESVLSEGRAKYSVAQIIEPDAEKTVPYFLYKELQEENKELIKKIMRLEMMMEKNNIID